MSFSEAVDASLMRDWRSTSEIASGIPLSSRTIDPYSHKSLVYKHLAKLERWGIAEKQICHNPGTNAYWRRRA